MSYAEVDRRSGVLAHRLVDLGAKPNTLVAIAMQQGWEQIVAAIAVLKAGAAYLPIDLALVPPGRVRELMTTGESTLALVQGDAAIEFPPEVAVVSVDEQSTTGGERDPAAAGPRCSAGDLAYCIFTSGSTGTPKGVMIEHRAVVITIDDINRRFEISADDRVLALASLGFDLSVWDIFGILGAGGAVVLPSAGARMSPDKWYEFACAAGVTVWNSVPKVMEMFVEHLEGRSKSLPPGLRLVMMSGDWIPVSLPDRIRARNPRADLRLMSLGGATEVSIWSIFYPIGKVEADWPSIPYGWSMTGQRVVVMDEQMRLRETWVPGEIYIGGEALARGYWRREDLTSRAFVTSPVDGERYYRTGDLGRYLPDGSIEFLGRRDTQVKIRGYRVELGEIEARAQQHPMVKQCLVLVHSSAGEGAGANGDKQLVAYLVLREGEDLSNQELARYLGERLPSYMVPPTMIRVDRIPLSANGKIDRKALPPPSNGPIARAEVVAPRDEIEAKVCAVWRSVLGVQTIGINDRFFDLGGDSIQLIRVAAAIEKECRVPFSLEAFFGVGLSAITVERCANVLRGSRHLARTSSALVAFQTEGKSIPFFAVHPVGGSVLCYGRMASLLGPQQRFYGLQSGVQNVEQPYDSIPELAAAYIREVRDVQPEGPYMLGGWSLGGTIAFEMARQLTRARERVGLVFLIDSWAPSGKTARVREEDLLEWFCRDLCGIARKDADVVLGGNAAATGWLQQAIALLRKQRVISPEVTDAAVREMFNRYCRAARAGAMYEPGTYDGFTVLVRASQQSSQGMRAHPALRNPQGESPTLGWSAFATGDLRVFGAPGDHYGIVGPEGLDVTTKLLADALRDKPTRNDLHSTRTQSIGVIHEA